MRPGDQVVNLFDMGLLYSIAIFGLMVMAAAGVVFLILRAMPTRTYVIPSKIPPDVMAKMLQRSSQPGGQSGGL